MREVNVRLVMFENRGWWKLRLVTDNETMDVIELGATSEWGALQEVGELLGQVMHKKEGGE